MPKFEYKLQSRLDRTDLGEGAPRMVIETVVDGTPTDEVCEVRGTIPKDGRGDLAWEMARRWNMPSEARSLGNLLQALGYMDRMVEDKKGRGEATDALETWITRVRGEAKKDQETIQRVCRR